MRTRHYRYWLVCRQCHRTYGLEGRWMTYDTLETKALDGIKTSQIKGTHLGLALQSNYTMHLHSFIVHHSTRTSENDLYWSPGFTTATTTI
jgi:hypothetical protein